MSARRHSFAAPAKRALLSSQEQDRLLAGVAFEAIWELDLGTEAIFGPCARSMYEGGGPGSTARGSAKVSGLRTIEVTLAIRPSSSLSTVPGG